MKLVPTLEACLADPDAYEIVVCIDDDVLIGHDMILKYKAFFQREGPCIASPVVSK